MESVRVATLNVWNKSGPWSQRLPLIRDELRRLGADVVGLQEVLRLELARGGEAALTAANDQALEIGAGLGFQHAYAPAGDYGNGLRLGNALLSRHPIELSRQFVLPGAETAETRALLFARVKTPLGPLPVFVTHLNWKFHQGSVRLSQVRYIVDRIQELAPPSDSTLLPAVLLGDMNAEPDSDEMRYLRGLSTQQGHSVFFADAWLYGGDGGPGYTFDRRNRFAAQAHEPSRRLDYILVRGGEGRLRGEPRETRVVFATPIESSEGELWPSDHFGLVTDITFRPNFS